MSHHMKILSHTGGSEVVNIIVVLSKGMRALDGKLDIKLEWQCIMNEWKFMMNNTELFRYCLNAAQQNLPEEHMH